MKIKWCNRKISMKGINWDFICRCLLFINKSNMWPSIRTTCGRPAQRRLGGIIISYSFFINLVKMSNEMYNLGSFVLFTIITNIQAVYNIMQTISVWFGVFHNCTSMSVCFSENFLFQDILLRLSCTKYKEDSFSRLFNAF